MNLDLVQLQWQRIRTAERERETELENVKLRKEIDDLNDRLKASEENDALSKKDYLNVLKAMQRKCSISKAELMKFKLETIKEMSAVLQEKDKLSSAFEHVFARFHGKESDVEVLKMKNRQLSQELENIRVQGQNNNAEQKAHTKEVQRLKSVIETLRKEVNEKELQKKSSDNVTKNLLGQVEQLKSELQQTLLEKDKTNSKYEVRV